MKAPVYGEIVENFWFWSFAKDLRRARKRHYWSQEDVAQRVGKSRVMVSNWENRIAMPTIPDFLFLCDMLELNPMQYFVIPEDMKPVKEAR